MSAPGLRLGHPDEQYALTVLRENLRRFEAMLVTAEAVANQIGPLRELVQTSKNAIAQFEAGQVVIPPSDIRPGEFSRMTLLDSLISYLEKRGGVAKLREEAIPALVLGAAATSKDRKSLADVKENARFRIVKNLIELHGRNMVQYDEAADTVKLK